MRTLPTYDEFVNENGSMKGGLADGKTVADVAKHHGISDDELSKQLEKGVKVESEHTNDPRVAREIAMDHLWEDPVYYDKLAKIEKD